MIALQPDGYLTEERKAADPDHGFSTFFSETGMRDVDPRHFVDEMIESDD